MFSASTPQYNFRLATMDEMRETLRSENQPEDALTPTLTRDEVILIVNLVDGVTSMRVASDANIGSLSKLRTKLSGAAESRKNDQ